MKNYLLTGTSALALVIAAGAANAQTAPGKFDIKISGDAFFEVGFAGTDLEKGADLNTADFTNRFRLVVNPEARADNGLTYGVVARIRANNADGNIDGDRAYIYVAGNFGTVRAGVVNGPSDDTYVANPADWQIFGLYDQWKTYVGGTRAPSKDFTGYAWGNWQGNATAWEGVQLLSSHGIDTKVVYYTPRFFGQTPTTGLQAGVSFTPNLSNGVNGDTSVNTNVNRSGYSSTCYSGTLGKDAASKGFCGVFENAYELTANYVENFNGVGVKASAGYEGGTAKKSPVDDGAKYNNLESAQVGLQFSYQGFALGGGFVWGGDSGYDKALTTAGGHLDNLDQYAWNVGGQYTWGPLVLGVKYTQQVENYNHDGVDNTDHVLGAVTAGALYTVAPGLRTGLEYTHFTDDVNAASGDMKNDSGDVFLLRAAVSF